MTLALSSPQRNFFDDSLEQADFSSPGNFPPMVLRKDLV